MAKFDVFINFLGTPAIGKSTLINRFYLEDQLDTSYTIHNLSVVEATMTVDGRSVHFTHRELEGHADHDAIRPLCYPQATVFVVCFAIDRIKSCNDVLEKWMPEIRAHRPDAPVLLVGTKADLRQDQATLDRFKQKGEELIQPFQGEQLAEAIGASGYKECSGLANIGVKEVFEEAIRVSLSGKSRPGNDKCLVQ